MSRPSSPAPSLVAPVSVDDVGTWEWEFATGTPSWNATLARLCGLPDVTGSRHDELRSLVHPDDLGAVRGAIADAAARRGEFRARFRLRGAVDGKARWMEAAGRLHVGADGTPLRASGVLVDVTGRMDAELDRQAQRELLDTVLANVPILIALWRVDGTLEWANQEYARIVGWSVAEMQGRDMLREFYPDPADHAAVVAYMARGVSDWSRWHVRARDGRVIPTSWANVRLADGRTLGIGRDDTAIVDAEAARERLEGQLRQAQKMEAIGQLAGGIAHDFNNLLTAIIGNTELARGELRRGVCVQAELAEVESAARRAAQLTRQLLAFSRKQVLQSRRIDLNEVVRGAERLLRRVIGEEIVLETILAPEPCTVVADPGQLEQVLLNLAVNARDAMLAPAHGRSGRGGVLTIETTIGDGHPGPEAGATLAGDCVRLRVRDTGQGMDAETRAHAFEPFFTTKAIGEGTGLGLATVYGIVTQSGGTIAIDSTPGVGTTFSIGLAHAEGEHQPELAGYASPAPQGVGTLLLVEDESLVRTTVRRMLERQGYSVLEARHGADALAIWREHHGCIAALVTDVRMPEMGGLELASLVRADDPALPVVFMSGYTDQRRVHGAGRGWHVAKPFTSDVLLAAVHDAIATRAAARR